MGAMPSAAAGRGQPGRARLGGVWRTLGSGSLPATKSIGGILSTISAENLSGKLIPAVPVPLNSLGQLHGAAQEAYASWMVRQPIGGVAAWAHTGRGLDFRPTPQDRVLESWRTHLHLPLRARRRSRCAPRRRLSAESSSSKRMPMARRAAEPRRGCTARPSAGRSARSS